MVLVNFYKLSDSAHWEIVNDVVMGGRSDGHIEIQEHNAAVFYGAVSLENNGGFSLVRHHFDPVDVSGYSKVSIRLRGDGKRYQFRVKSDPEKQHAYIHYFETNGEWQTVEISLADMYPTYKGKRLEIPNFPGRQLAEIGFLIGNGQAESFRLELGEILLL